MRISFIATIILWAYLAAPAMAAAATVSFSPSTLTGTAGSATAFSVIVEPAGDTAYTVKLELRYPPALLDFVSFQQTNGWLSLPQEGYDVVDEDEGVIVKTAGFPGGISEPRSFGTFTFVAASAGSDTVVATDATLVLDATNANIAEGLPVQMSVQYGEPAVQPTQTAQPAAQQTDPPVVSAEDDGAESDAEAIAEAATGEEQAAAAGSAGSGFPWMALLAALLLAIIAGTFAYLWEREQRR